ncbi:Acetylxylan esterase 2 [Escovopsis weberi]|uniref:Acetylxylan esterase 2 n=1 Tax=Escovopsis weberi TaxID=150374 RepID=A0A0M8N6N7_ESCWE|nr:Acetylxylan esterase 2 [Escovopsis weberi]
MRGFSSIAMLAAGSLAAAADSSSAATPSCADGLYMVVARGSLEPPGPGSAGVVTAQVQKKIPGSVVASVDYPATLDDYENSETDGVTAIHGLLDAYGKACPSSLMAIIGYSQGAQIGMDAVCGGIGGFFTSQAPVSSAILDNIVAVNVFGDPTHIPNLPYDVGTSVKKGIFQRNSTANCLKSKDKIISFCDTGDIYCDGGSNLTTHHIYIDKYGSQMVDFIVDKYNTAKGAASGGSNTTPPSGTGTKPTSGAKPTSTGPAPNAAGPAMMAPPASLLGAAVLVVVTSALSSL